MKFSSIYSESSSASGAVRMVTVSELFKKIEAYSIAAWMSPDFFADRYMSKNTESAPEATEA